jgi:hypothetical protein
MASGGLLNGSLTIGRLITLLITVAAVSSSAGWGISAALNQDRVEQTECINRLEGDVNQNRQAIDANAERSKQNAEAIQKLQPLREDLAAMKRDIRYLRQSVESWMQYWREQKGGS